MNLFLPIAAVLLALPAAGLFAWLADPAGRLALGAREAAAWTAVAWATLSVIFVELLSRGAGHDLTAARGGHLTRDWLLAAWALPALAGAVVAVARRNAFKATARGAYDSWRSCSVFEQLIVVLVALCLIVVGTVALLAAPNTWDSMTYHLARVAAWLRLGGVSDYATSAEPQLFQPPGAELLIAQWQALVGSDRMAAFVQWAAYALSVGTISLVAARLRAGRRGQLIAAALAATTPMALLEGSSTQNDLVVALWLLIAGALTVAVGQEQRLAKTRIAVVCTAIGLAVLTKGTALLYAPPIIAVLTYVTVRRLGWLRAIAIGAAGVLIVVALNTGQWSRNHQTYGAYVYSAQTGQFDYSNDSYRPGALISNLVRNAALYAGTPSSRLNEYPTKAVRHGLKFLHIDADSPATTFYGQSFIVPKSGPDENHGASPLLFLLTAWAIAMVCCAPRYRTPARIAWSLIVLAQILLFCLAIKWQPWHVRLHLPFVLAGIPLIAVALERLKRQWIGVVVVAVAAVAAPFYVVLNVNRPLVGDGSVITTARADQYFTPRPSLRLPYLHSIALARKSGVRELGVSGNFDDWYYPFSALADGDPQISETLIGNRSGRWAAGRPIPDAVVCLHCEADRQATLTAAGLRKRAVFGGTKTADEPYPITVEYWSR